MPRLLVLSSVLLACSFSGVQGQCSFDNGVDYQDSGSEAKAKSREECCSLCQANKQCQVAVFADGMCYLKDGMLGPKKKDGVVACKPPAKPTPAPVPPAPEYDCSKREAHCAARIGATHWNPCYFVNKTAPSLIDGAQAVARMGSRVIKVAAFNPKGNYPFNSPDWPNDRKFTTLLSILQHKYYRQLWEMPFETYVLIAYSTVGGAGGEGISYWTNGITAEQEAEETKQFYDAALWVLRTYGGNNKIFVFENWEGDWASRAGGYDPSTPATPLSLQSMTKWLQARQKGVTQARSQWVAEMRLLRGPDFTPGTVRVTAPTITAPAGNVYFSAEVNLVQLSRTTGATNMINEVIPHVATDMVSYSSYDTMASVNNFRAALQYIAAQHNRTAAAPEGGAAVFVAEFGYAQNQVPNATQAATFRNVVNEALAFGAAFVLFWETYDNECVHPGGGSGCSPSEHESEHSRAGQPGLGAGNGRCHDASKPVTNPDDLAGFWLVRPDGSTAWPFQYFKSKIAEGHA